MQKRVLISMVSAILMAGFLTGCSCLDGFYDWWRSDDIRAIETLSPRGPGVVLGRYEGKIDSQGMLTIDVVGKGIPPENAINKAQAILLAERAAITDGYRKLAERVSGIYLQAFTRMGMEKVDSDFVQVETDTWLRGAHVQQVKHVAGGITEAKVQVKVHVASVYYRTQRLRTSSEYRYN